MKTLLSLLVVIAVVAISIPSIAAYTLVDADQYVGFANGASEGERIIDGSDPEIIKRGFASIETALLFDVELRNRLLPEQRRFAVCLASRLYGRMSEARASEADIKRWGIDGTATVPEGARFYKHPWGVLLPPLKEIGLLDDPWIRSWDKLISYLRLAPVFSNRRQSKPLERPTNVLRDEKIPTVAVPSVYFEAEKPVVADEGESGEK